MHYIHTFIHRWQRKPCKSPTCTSGAIIGVQSLAQGHFDTNSGGARDRTGNRAVPSGHSTPEPPPPTKPALFYGWTILLLPQYPGGIDRGIAV